MHKIVSKGKYMLFFEKNKNDIDCVAYENGKHMSNGEIGETLGISRISVSNNIKKSILKIYKRIKHKKEDITPMEIILSMIYAFNINSIEEYKQFLKLFPNNIIKEVCQSLTTKVRGLES